MNWERLKTWRLLKRLAVIWLVSGVTERRGQIYRCLGDRINRSWRETGDGGQRD